MSTASAGHVDKTTFGNVPTYGRLAKVMWPGLPHLGSIEPVLCAMSFPCVILSMTMNYFGDNEDMHGFWSIWCSFVIDVPEMVDQQNSRNSLIISTYLLYVE
jgi:hypothetical protein